MKKYIRVLLLAALVCSLLAGCSIETKSSKDSQDESKYHLYYLNESETVLREEPYSPGEETADFMVKDLMQKLGAKMHRMGKSVFFRKMFPSILMKCRKICLL